ncbi:SCP2 sterol-binding domain-containing protein [Thermoflexus sp.]|uniref:SCP2 sterol-binding domain-containing protein n=2 Tax=Thermoflexus sp. TaxID=1969742 RepID=UPI00260D1323|nr:SCP2 sterol-binding domain-containing protein [Thermoflexus sp.]MCX7689191.1 SCP2 sterol-binding domain-containing protein [Thermoflexus sp.]MDW8184963.1 SCP2 sterol-binding domain-containing protein [Anaerolineae bacterium]
MERQRQRAIAFVVRIWLEETQSEGRLRGEVADLHTGETRPFANEIHLLRCLWTWIRRAGSRRSIPFIQEEEPMSSLTARDVIMRMPEAFQPDKAQGVNATIQYSLTGEGGGDWYIVIAEGACSVHEGKAEKADVTLTMDAQDFVDIATGKLDAMKAFMGGKLKVSGNMMLATRLTSFFRIG